MEQYRSLCSGDPDRRVAHLVVEMYGRSGRVEDAVAVFNAIPSKNVYSWNMLIAAFARNGFSSNAITCFRQMQSHGFRPDGFTLTTVLGPFSTLKSLLDCRRVHSHLGHLDEVSASALIQAYGKCGSLSEAASVLLVETERKPDVWNALMAAYVQNGCVASAVELFRMMKLMGVKPDVYTFTAVATACCGHALRDAVSLYDEICLDYYGLLKQHEFVRVAMVEMFGTLGCVELAGEVFSLVAPQGPALKNAMLAAFARNGEVEQAEELFETMQSACEADRKSWTVLISAFMQHGDSKHAFKLLRRMNLEGNKADEVTFVALAAACSLKASIVDARQVHEHVVNSGHGCFVSVGNALLNMYAKCGGIEEARCLFKELEWRKDLITWSSMIEACAQNGCTCEALYLFREMQVEGFHPSFVTFLGVLSACRHAGFLHEALSYFSYMLSDDYSLQQRLVTV